MSQVDFTASGRISLLIVRIERRVKMWIYDYRTKKEYLASSPRSKFYNYISMVVEPVPGKPCTILIKKEMEEGRKPEKIFE